jgi:large exoprotein involved in heme utilization and adhesion
MNCKHRRPQAQQPDPARRLHLNRLALAVALALGGTSPWVLAQALPSGASVVQGQASIVTQGQQMTISNSANAVLNWQSFSIGAGSSVRFEQPVRQPGSQSGAGPRCSRSPVALAATAACGWSAPMA